MASERILVVDDEEGMCELLESVLAAQGFKVRTAEGLEDARRLLGPGRWDMIVTDLKMEEDDSGLELLRQARAADPETIVIIMTGYGSIQSAVQAIKLGATDYITKPLMLDEIKNSVAKALERKRLLEENVRLKADLDGQLQLKSIVGTSALMREVYAMVLKVARSRATALICGDSGTGKELIARAIHNQSERADRRLVTVNCSAIPDNLIESELFGHERGAFTGAVSRKKGLFEEADTGTIFLDEIGDVPVAMQPKLLRVLQEGEIKRVGGNETLNVDVRVVAATNRDLEHEIERGNFREDLYYRINVVTIRMPALARRRDDIPLLISHFVEKYNREYSKQVSGLAPEAADALMAYEWPGNVRELEHVIERAVALIEAPGPIRIEHLPPERFQARDGDFPLAAELLDAESFKYAKSAFEKEYVLRLLARAGGNVSKAARLSGIPRQNLYEKIRKHEIDHGDFKD